MTAEPKPDGTYPPVQRRVGRGGLSECLCSRCGKWSTFGIILGTQPPYRYVCPECSQEPTP